MKDNRSKKGFLECSSVKERLSAPKGTQALESAQALVRALKHSYQNSNLKNILFFHNLNWFYFGKL